MQVSQRSSVGVDVGGTKIAVAIIEESGEIVDEMVVPTPGASRRVVLETIAKTVWRLVPSGPTPPIGVGIPGVVALGTGQVAAAASTMSDDWAGPGLGSDLEELLCAPVRLCNDGNAFAFAEHTIGAGRGRESGLFVTVGTGIGGGLVVNGRLVRGRRGAAGEIGHMMSSHADRRSCSCGAAGHLEAIAAGAAIERSYFQRSGRPAMTRAVAELATQGDPAAFDVLWSAGVGSGVRSTGRSVARRPRPHRRGRRCREGRAAVVGRRRARPLARSG